MARSPKPWFRDDRRVWCVTIDGVRHNLGPDRREAHTRFKQLLRQPLERRPATDATSFAAIADEYLDWTAQNRSPATYEWYRSRLQAFLDLHPAITAEELKPYLVEKWASAGDRTRATRRNLMRAIKRPLRWAVSRGLLQRNPIESLEVPSGEARDVYVSPEQLEMLLSASVDPGFVELLRVTYETGCRPQESLRVEARHYDPSHSRWVFPSGESKGRKMPRVVYLSDLANEVTGRLSRLHPEGPIFRNSAGRPWNKSSVGCAFDRLQIQAREGRDGLTR